ncbi:MAG: carboxynorspermidine decarboxylase, partial [Bacteroidota bacterium]
DNYWFKQPLLRGDTILFEDMLHYTTVKTTMFNGVEHPDLIIKKLDGSEEVVRRFDYTDYRGRMG